MLSALLLAVGIGLILFVFYKRATLGNDYFAKRNLVFLQPTFPFGNSAKFFLSQCSSIEWAQMLYNSFPHKQMYGLFDILTPFVVVRDPQLLKQLTVKEFDHFEDHRPFIDISNDELFGTSLIMMKGQRWRDMRATLSPAFTGSKMRQMFHMVSECADDMTKYFVKKATDGEKIDVEMNDVFARYTNDVIASCAFGVNINSFDDPNNAFFGNAKGFKTTGGRLASVIFIFIRALPFVFKKLNIQLTAPIRVFFTTMITDSMDERTKRGIVRPDMVNLLMQVRQGKLNEDEAKELAGNAQRDSAGFATVEESEIGRRVPQRLWSDKEIISQCFQFFLAGFDTTSLVLTFLTYELCANPDIQQRLYEEIAETNRNLDGNRLNYETLQKMKYMDMVISEGLRKWPAVGVTDRLCVKDYLCEYGDNEKFRFEKGVGLWIPVYGFHHDPKYYPEPEQFDPERFSDENKSNIVPGTYLPFGIGPRNCIGILIALVL